MFHLTTSDSVKIAADWYHANEPRGYLILVHMMPATRHSWRTFAESVIPYGYASIAIDLRGHGDSDGGPRGYEDFSDKEHQASSHDLQATVDFLKGKGAFSEKIIFIGASIGANLSLQYLVEHPEHRTAALLSAGLNYYGIRAIDLVPRLSLTQRVLFIASRDDKNVPKNVEMNEKLVRAAPEGMDKKLIVYDMGGHGTDMLQVPEIVPAGKEILEFLEKRE